MKQVKDTREKICAFYASDYHFEMMSLPYIDKRIENKDKIIILTENNLEETMQTLLARTNLQENRKKQILKLNWKNDDPQKIENIKVGMNEQKDMIIFVKGKENYIRKINQDIEKWIPEENHVKIIDCYSIEEVGENLDEVMNQYHKILRTTGEKEIEKL